MKIELQGSDKIMVELTDADMEALDITYEEMDYSNIETRRVIWTLLDRASRVLGRNISTAERMLSEALPGNEGGCVLFFTRLPCAENEGQGRRLIMKKEARPVLLTTDDCSTLLSITELLRTAASDVEFEVYLALGEYSVVMRPNPQERERLMDILCEFGECIQPDEHELAVLSEHAKRLI